MYVFLAFIIFVALSAAIFVVDDMLLKQQYKYHRERWIADGRPRGLVFSPPRGSYSASRRLAFRSRDAKFSWVHGDARAERLYKILRKIETIFIVYFVCFVPLVLILVALQ